jgi:phenylalanyl-tRNA synthetase alpha chain
VDETFPYTDPSIEIEVKVGDLPAGQAGEWVEIVGSGLPKKEVLKNFGLTGYNGWAFGFGIERLAIISMKLPDIRLLWSDDARVKKQLVLGTAFEEVSKYPPAYRDISFVVPKSFVPNNYFDLVRDIAGELVEEVELTDKYENDKKFGKDKMSYTYHITYRSLGRTLTNEEVDKLHKVLEQATRESFAAEVR